MKTPCLSQHSQRTRRLGVRCLTTALIAATATIAFAGLDTAPTTDVTVDETSGFADWWNGKYMTGNWFGVRDTLEDHGIKFTGKWNGAFYGVVDSEGGQKGFFDQEVAFAAEVKFDKLLGVEALEGLKGFGGVRWRQPDSSETPDPNTYVQASGNFQPSHYQSGTQWRLITFGLEYATPEVFGVEDFLTLRGGWLQPQKEFIDQPLSKLFVNNSFESSKGIGANIPFSSSFSTWGGTLEVKPADWAYIKGGLFLAFPSSTSSSNHGLAFEGYARNPDLNSYLVMGEVGVTPKIGPAELDGHYAAGGYFYGVDKKSFNGTQSDGVFGFYWQADQMLCREASPDPEPVVYEKGSSDGKSIASSGKSFKEPVPMEEPKLSDQGLYTFNLITFAPKYNNPLAFYFQSGLVYKGLIPSRDKDQFMIAFGLGQYSFLNIEQLQDNGKTNQPNYTAVLEVDYRIQINGWAYTQPFVQYIIKPNGSESVQNATILGVLSGVVF